MIRSVPNPTKGDHAALFLEPRNPDEWMYDINIEYNHVLNCRILTNQFVTDMYSEIELERLGYIQNEQKGLRADLYKVIDDALENDTDLRTIGKRVILPSSFTGGPRHMHEYSQDAMAYVRTHGRPDLFITFTCNSNWEEIKVNLKYGQQSHHRHDFPMGHLTQTSSKLLELLLMN